MALLQEALTSSRIRAVTPKEHLSIVRVPETTIYQFPTKERKQASPQTLSELVVHFDTNWREEGLPRDWYTLGNKVGFSMQTQMNVLGGVDRLSREQWIEKTTRDVQGFALEYLTKGLVYPFEYEITTDGKLVDPKYGNTDFVETTTEKERNGSVKNTYQEVKSFFLDDKTPEGSLVVITSPLGPSGLVTDEGKPITYPDSYFFLLQKTQGKVKGVTIKTDFSKDESRDVIKRLTGKTLAEDAPLEAYVESVAYMTPATQKMDAQDIVDILATVRERSPYAFQRQTWQEVYRDIDRQEELYQFSEKTEQMIEEFKAYVLSDSVTKIDIQKALAATILRISKQFLFNEKQIIPQQRIGDRHPVDIKPLPPISYGHVLAEVAKIPGCAGGGKATAVTSIGGLRLGVDSSASAQEWFSCPKCEYHADGPVGNECPGCGLTKEAYAEESGVVCD